MTISSALPTYRIFLFVILHWREWLMKDPNFNGFRSKARSSLVATYRLTNVTDPSSSWILLSCPSTTAETIFTKVWSVFSEIVNALVDAVRVSCSHRTRQRADPFSVDTHFHFRKHLAKFSQMVELAAPHLKVLQKVCRTPLDHVPRRGSP